MSAKRPCIVVVTYRCPEMVRDCLRSLIEDGWLNARSHADSRAQVVVVDILLEQTQTESTPEKITELY